MDEQRALDALSRLLTVIARLRAPDGCPWDREQTEATMAPHLLEETYEAVDAIHTGSPQAIRDELGDVLMNVLMIAQIASETGRFDAAAVATGIGDKLVRRHPHVFGDVVASDADQVLRNWERIKRTEREAADDAARSALAGVPADLPALLRAFRIGEKAARVGFDWPDPAGPRHKLDEELAEFDQALASGDSERQADELGDVLFSAVNLARHHGLNPEMALRKTIQRFTARFQRVETELGERLGTAGIDELEAAWQRAKAGD